MIYMGKSDFPGSNVKMTCHSWAWAMAKNAPQLAMSFYPRTPETTMWFYQPEIQIYDVMTIWKSVSGQAWWLPPNVDLFVFLVLQTMLWCLSPRALIMTVPKFIWQNFFLTYMGAGCRCRSPTFCPLLVLCPVFSLFSVHLLSLLCPYFVFVPFLTLFVQQIPTFVHFQCIFCPPCLIFVLFLPKFLAGIWAKNDWTKARQNLDKMFSLIYNLVNLWLDKI